MKTTSQSDLLRRHAEEIAALKATIARQAQVVKAARPIAAMSRPCEFRLIGGWSQFNARLLVEAGEIAKVLHELDANS